ncbi:MAG: amino acid adenylation domain-containing protein [Lachnospiraceae bacterium]|nr:amino acid adenylation domain-containing protein [Lachnospiraceae bacterium]
MDIFENTAAAYPEKIAVEDEAKAITWKELAVLSRRAGTGIAVRIGRREPVALFMPKQAAMLAAMLGAAYAGCFYVPVDPTQPSGRLAHIWSVLQPKLVVTLPEYEECLARTGYVGEVCFLADLLKTEADEAQLSEIRQQVKDTDLLYGIFTSGSTGVPKGIVVSQRAVMDFIGHFTTTFGIAQDEVFGNQAPFDFDVSVKDIYSCLFTGARLVLIPQKMFSMPPVLLDYLCERKVTTLVWAVSALTLVSGLKGLKYRVPEYVHRIMFSGEVMPVKQLRLWQKALPAAEFVNLYGPTEITCNCTYYRLPGYWESDDKLPLGQAFDGREVFLMDEEDRRVDAPGQEAEICVSGESLAAGYYHNEEETNRRFVQLIIDGVQKRCYRTGDLGYYDEGGRLYFAGRKDFQIKHMGHRIELEEIERAINALEGVEANCCLMNEKRNQLICYYYGTAAAEEIRSHLKEQLPIFMVPHKFYAVDSMPLTKNGKIDRGYFRDLNA